MRYFKKHLLPNLDSTVSMRPYYLILSFFCAILLSSCAARFPGVGILAPESIAGYRMDASGMKGSYIYDFLPNSTYQSQTTLPSKKRSPIQTGTWKWERTSPSEAILTLDNTLVVKLDYTTAKHANAKLAGEKRLYPVLFRKLE